LPVREETGYSQSALSEPWACVEMSYNLEDRFEPGEGPVLIVTDEMPPQWVASHPNAVTAPPSPERLPEGMFNDIILPRPTPALVEALGDRLEKGGNMYLLGHSAEAGQVNLDVGRIHYENLRFYGGAEDIEGLRRVNERADLLPGGTAIFIGAGGPMGQMHVQRAIELERGSKTVVVTDLDKSRLDHIENRFGEIADRRGVQLICLAPDDFDSQEAMNDRVREIAPDGYTDVCLLAPVPRLVTFATGIAADNGLVNLFAGIPAGTKAPIELNDLCRGVKIIGSSGSRISDLRSILHMVEAGDLNTNLSVAAIGGLQAARIGLEGVKEGRFPGKTVIYPQIPDLELTPLEDLPEKMPEVASKLGPRGEWTKEAEQALLEKYM
jgi:hypothetical protein